MRKQERKCSEDREESKSDAFCRFKLQGFQGQALPLPLEK